MRLIAWGRGKFREEEGQPVRRRKGETLWLHFQEPLQDLSLEEAGKALGLHPLALEDARHSHQRPKFEEYDESYFCVLPLLSLEPDLHSSQISFFFGADYVVSVTPQPLAGFDAVAARLRHDRAKLRNKGADALMHALLDTVIDGYVPLLAQVDERFSELEMVIASSSPERASAPLRRMRLDLFNAHRLLMSLETALQKLFTDREDLICPEMQPYFKDLLDHVARDLDHVDSLREAAGDLMQLQHAALTVKTNEAMQVLTIISTIFIPLSFIAGVYGMNFKYMPELDSPHGYALSMALMAVVALGFVIFFRRRGWLGKGLFWRQ